MKLSASPIAIIYIHKRSSVINARERVNRSKIERGFKMHNKHSDSDSVCPTVSMYGLPALLDEKSLAAWLHVNTRTLQNWRRDGEFPEPVKFGCSAQSMKLFVVEEVREWIEEKIQNRPEASIASR